MEPFNIRINSGSKQTTLTILPIDEKADYKVILNGAILGGIRRMGTDWIAMADEELIAGDLPLYTSKFGEESEEIKLDEQTVQLIGQEITAAAALN